MKTPPRRDLELNELGWWGKWAKLEWLGKDAYLLSSKEFPETFYNRGGLLSCGSVASLRPLEGRLSALGARPALMVFDSCRGAARALASSGYRKEDTMTVMASASSAAGEAGVETGRAKSARAWAEAYLKAFYGELSLLPTVLRIVRQLMQNDRTTILEARLEGRAAGTLAAYRTGGLLGVYCVGTTPGFRGRGAAGALIAHASDLASSEGRVLFLQTLESDGVVPFYLRRGFRVLYRKNLMTKKGY